MRTALLCSLFSLIIHQSNAQLIINEISQGTGTQEYVEFVVIGTPTCQTPVPTVDLRGIVFDDNNGYFAAGGGTGIAPGAMRFSNNAFWSAIPQGTIIVVYNELSPNPAIPANDLSITDGNCRLIIPANSNLIEGQGSAPNLSDNTYPISASWTAGGGSWNQVAMANGDDSFQIRSSISSTTPNYSVSWGNNTTNDQIFFASASGNVFSFTNQTSNNPLTQANWIQGAVGTDETPGLPNSPQNQTWLGSMNPICYGGSPLNLSFNVTPTACGANCTGSATVNVSGGSSPYSYSWNTGATTATISNQCSANYTVTVTDNAGCSATADTLIPQNSNLVPQTLVANETCQGYCDGGAIASAIGGTAPYSYSWSNSFNGSNNQNLCAGWYILTVTDQNGCTGTLNVTINSGISIPNSAISDPGTHLISEGFIPLTSSVSGGTWSSSCGTCISNSGVFNADQSGEGTFEVCYTTTNGSCNSTSCDSITIGSLCQDVETSYYGQLCEGDTLTINGIEYTEIGVYSQTAVMQNGCDSTVHLFLNPCFDGNSEIEIPNVITPNGDQLNDIWYVNLENLKLREGFIVNRWGQTIRTFVDDKIEWNGKINEIDVVEGVYFYQLTFYSEIEGEFTKQGFIQVYK